MYSRVTLLEIDTMRTSVDEALALFTDEVLPQLREQAGYEGVLVLATEEGKGLLLSLWATEEDAQGGAFYPGVLERYLTLFSAPPGRERYQVAFADLPSLAER